MLQIVLDIFKDLLDYCMLPFKAYYELTMQYFFNVDLEPICVVTHLVVSGVMFYLIFKLYIFIEMTVRKICMLIEYKRREKRRRKKKPVIQYREDPEFEEMYRKYVKE